MNIIKIKVHSFDTNTNTIIVSSASDETKSQNPDDYTKTAYQPIYMWPDEQDISKIIRNLAYASLKSCEDQKLVENLDLNSPIYQNLKAIEGEIFEFNVEELINSYNV